MVQRVLKSQSSDLEYLYRIKNGHRAECLLILFLKSTENVCLFNSTSHLILGLNTAKICFCSEIITGAMTCQMKINRYIPPGQNVP